MTLNPRVGADKDFNAFSNEVMLRTEEFSPTEAQEGRFHHRGLRIYAYLRDRVFPTLQKFNKSLRHIYACNPTGVTDQQKINMAVALHLQKVTTMDYAFKDFSPSTWKQYGGWLAVKHLPKFAYNVTIASGVEVLSEVTASHSELSQEDTDTLSNSTSSQTSVPAQGTKRGRDAARERESRINERRERTEERNKQFGEVAKNMSNISEQFLKKSKVAVIVQALQVAPEGETKEKLKEKLMELALQM